jgi:hypothetical protein
MSLATTNGRYTMLDNEDRADYGENAVVAVGSETNVITQDDISTTITDVLAYIAHFCDRVGIDPEETFKSGLQSYEGDFEDGPPAEYNSKRFPERGESWYDES